MLLVCIMRPSLPPRCPTVSFRTFGPVRCLHQLYQPGRLHRAHNSSPGKLQVPNMFIRGRRQGFVIIICALADTCRKASMQV